MLVGGGSSPLGASVPSPSPAAPAASLGCEVVAGTSESPSGRGVGLSWWWRSGDGGGCLVVVCWASELSPTADGDAPGSNVVRAVHDPLHLVLMILYLGDIKHV